MDKVGDPAVICDIQLEGLSPKEIHDKMVLILEEDALPMALSKSGQHSSDAAEKVEHDPRSGRPLTASTPERVDKIHDSSWICT